jgi:hypothetical protein
MNVQKKTKKGKGCPNVRNNRKKTVPEIYKIPRTEIKTGKRIMEIETVQDGVTELLEICFFGVGVEDEVAEPCTDCPVGFVADPDPDGEEKELVATAV